jgi:hypothetical protein
MIGSTDTMKLITPQSPTSRTELKQLASEMFGNLVKAVVDVKNEIMVIQAELHADEEAFLLQNDSKQEDLWGINLYPEIEDEDFIEFDSMINLRPSQGNMSRGVDKPEIQSKIRKIIAILVTS